MFSVGLPWIVGPVPIVLTCWSGYQYGKMIVLKRATTGANFLVVFLLPIGFVSVLMQIISSSPNLFPGTIICQALSSTLSFLIAFLANFRSKDTPDFPKKGSNIAKSASSALLFFVVYILINLLFMYVPLNSSCNSGKCYMGEVIFGARNEIFSSIYIGTVFGSFILMVVFTGILQIIANLR